MIPKSECRFPNRIMRTQLAMTRSPRRNRDLESRDLQLCDAQSRDLQHPDAQPGVQANPWHRIATSRRLTIFFWVYVSQAVAGSVAGFIAPFLYYFGVL
jgi:hypothetical protein